jgi:hypothetical protein
MFLVQVFANPLDLRRAVISPSAAIVTAINVSANRPHIAQYVRPDIAQYARPDIAQYARPDIAQYARTDHPYGHVLFCR